MWILHFVFFFAAASTQAASARTLESASMQEAAVPPSPLGEIDISKLQSQADAGDAAAEVKLAQEYETGSRLPQNYELALKWYRKAAEQGSAAADNSLGLMYLLGRGVERNKETAVDWYRKSARLGYGPAMYNLGTAYYNGEGVAIDDTLSFAWFLLAQEAGHPAAAEAVERGEAESKAQRRIDAFTRIAEIYEKGDGLRKIGPRP